MKNDLTKIIKGELRFLAIETRNNLGLTQREMSNLLQMNESSYSDIETGKYLCGTLTTILLLTMMEDPGTFVETVKSKFADWYEKEMQSI